MDTRPVPPFRRGGWIAAAIFIALFSTPSTNAHAATTPAPASSLRADEPPTYWQDVRPLLQKHCTICHATKNIEKKEVGGGLALSTFDATLKDPKEPVVLPGKSGDSKLYLLLVTDDQDVRMPKDADPLEAAEIELIKKWIDAGAKEGSKPAEPAAEPAAPAVRRPTSLERTLDVQLQSTTSVPEAVAKSLEPSAAKAGKLGINLRIAPLPPVTALGFSSAGKSLAVGSYGTLSIWDLENAVISHSIEFPGAIHSIAFNSDGSLAAVAGGLPARTGEVKIFRTDTWQVAASIAEHSDVVYDASFSPDGQKLATASLDKTVRIWTVADGKSVQTLKGHSDFVYGVAFTPDGKWLISSSKDRSIKIYSTETWQSERTLSGHNEDVLTVAVSADSYNVVSAGKEPQLKWWILENGQNNRNMGGHSGTVNEIVFSKDGKRLASVGQDKNVRIWDAADGKLLKTLSGSTEWLYSVAFSPDARFVAAGSWDGLVRVWDTESGRLLVTLLAPPAPDLTKPQWLAFTPEGYFDCTEDLGNMVRWQIEGQAVAGAMLNSLRQRAVVQRVLAGEAVEAPKFNAE